jgi:hypothetical protein
MRHLLSARNDEVPGSSPASASALKTLPFHIKPLLLLAAPDLLALAGPSRVERKTTLYSKEVTAETVDDKRLSVMA